jgi:hypothetical protein
MEVGSSFNIAIMLIMIDDASCFISSPINTPFHYFMRFFKVVYLPSGSDDEDDLGFSFNEDVSFGSGLSSGINVSSFSSLILLEVLL